MRKWLKEKRTERNMTMKDIAEKLGISESYYCSIENGERQKKMDITLVAGLSVALEVPVSEIMKSECQI